MALSVLASGTVITGNKVRGTRALHVAPNPDIVVKGNTIRPRDDAREPVHAAADPGADEEPVK